MEIIYHQHKEHKSVICIKESGFARFSKWVWKGLYCFEVEKTKKVSTNLETSFNQITQKEYNQQWGLNLQNA